MDHQGLTLRNFSETQPVATLHLRKVLAVSCLDLASGIQSGHFPILWLALVKSFT